MCILVFTEPRSGRNDAAGSTLLFKWALASRSRHANGNRRNTCAELDGCWGAGSDVHFAGFILGPRNDFLRNIGRKRCSGPDAETEWTDHTQSLQHRDLPTLSTAASNGGSGLDTANPRQHGDGDVVDRLVNRSIRNGRDIEHGIEHWHVDIRDSARIGNSRRRFRYSDHKRRPVERRRIVRIDEADPAQLANLVGLKPGRVDAHRQERPERHGGGLHEDVGAVYSHEQG
jgi:hypothetical protein